MASLSRDPGPNSTFVWLGPGKATVRHEEGSSQDRRNKKEEKIRRKKKKKEEDEQAATKQPKVSKHLRAAGLVITS